MNQVEQIREALRILREIHPGNMTPMAEESWKNATRLLEQALASEYQTQPSGQFVPVDEYMGLPLSEFGIGGHIANAIMDAMDRINGGAN